VASAGDQIERDVRSVAEEVAHAEGVELYDILLRRNGPRWKVQVFLSRGAENVSIDDCVRVSRQLSRELDVLDPIPRAYDLEVSSPGIERAIRTDEHWRAAIGATARIKFRDADKGNVLVIVGTVDAITDEDVTLTEPNGTTHRVAREGVVSARVHVDW